MQSDDEDDDVRAQKAELQQKTDQQAAQIEAARQELYQSTLDILKSNGQQNWNSLPTPPVANQAQSNGVANLLMGGE